MNIPNYVKDIMEKLNKDGFEAYAVGGCVRDAIMGKNPSDYDVTTNATPEEMKVCFSDFRIFMTGEKHGTVTVLSDGENVEVTTYRVDGEYRDNRRPESVSFTKSLEEDLKRRDFTMNAICFNSSFYDPFDGRRDIERRIIRTVGDADRRFGEDALRIMRALRFLAVLGFEIEEKTKESIHRNKELLKNISAERLFSELKKLLMGDYCEKVLLEYWDVIGVFIPEIVPCVGFDQKNRYHIYDVYTHIVKSVGYAKKDIAIRLAMLFHDIGKPMCFSVDEKGGHFTNHALISKDMAREILLRLKADNDTRDIVLNLVHYHQREVLPEKKYVKRFLSRFSFEFFDMLLEVMRADTLAHSKLAEKNLEDIETLRRIRYEIEEENECVSLKKLAVNGHDVINAGISDGKTIGKILRSLLDDVIEGKMPNERDALLKKITEH